MKKNIVKTLHMPNEPKPIIKIYGLPIDQIPKDCPKALNDRTWVDILEGVKSGISMSSILSEKGCPNTTIGQVMEWIFEDPDRIKLYRDAEKLEAETLKHLSQDVVMSQIYDPQQRKDILANYARSQAIQNSDQYNPVQKVEVTQSGFDASAIIKQQLLEEKTINAVELDDLPIPTSYTIVEEG